MMDIVFGIVSAILPGIAAGLILRQIFFGGKPTKAEKEKWDAFIIDEWVLLNPVPNESKDNESRN